MMQRVNTGDIRIEPKAISMYTGVFDCAVSHYKTTFREHHKNVYLVDTDTLLSVLVENVMSSSWNVTKAGISHNS